MTELAEFPERLIDKALDLGPAGGPWRAGGAGPDIDPCGLGPGEKAACGGGGAGDAVALPAGGAPLPLGPGVAPPRRPRGGGSCPEGLLLLGPREAVRPWQGLSVDRGLESRNGAGGARGRGSGGSVWAGGRAAGDERRCRRRRNWALGLSPREPLKILEEGASGRAGREQGKAGASVALRPRALSLAGTASQLLAPRLGLVGVKAQELMTGCEWPLGPRASLSPTHFPGSGVGSWGSPLLASSWPGRGVAVPAL